LTVSSSARAGANRRSTPSNRVRLGDVAEVGRGIATGANGFFVLTEQRRLALHLTVEQVMPCLPRPRLLSGLEVQDSDLASLAPTVPRWLVQPSDAEREGGPTALAAYLRWGRERGICDGYLVTHRRRWFAVESAAPAAIIVPYIQQCRRPRFLRNRSSAVVLNTYLVVRPRAGVDADALWEALNTPAFLRSLRPAGRELGNLAWKIEPGVLATLPLQSQMPSNACAPAEPSAERVPARSSRLATSVRTSCEPSRGAATAPDLPTDDCFMPSSARIYQASDLNQNGRAILDAARESVARVRDKDGTSLVMLPEERLEGLRENAEDLVGLGEAVASYVTLQRAVAQLDSRPVSLAEYGVFTWARTLRARQLTDFVRELGDALILCGRERSSVPLRDTVAPWRALAESTQ